MTSDPPVVADLPDEGEFFLVPVGANRSRPVGLMVGHRDEAKKTGDFNAPDPLLRGQFATVIKRFASDAGVKDYIEKD